jgi:hypothetical protein
MGNAPVQKADPPDLSRFLRVGGEGPHHDSGRERAEEEPPFHEAIPRVHSPARQEPLSRVVAGGDASVKGCGPTLPSGGERCDRR